MIQDRVYKHRKNTLKKIREEIRERGYNVPDSDKKLFSLLNEVGPSVIIPFWLTISCEILLEKIHNWSNKK